MKTLNITAKDPQTIIDALELARTGEAFRYMEDYCEGFKKRAFICHAVCEPELTEADIDCISKDCKDILIRSYTSSGRHTDLKTGFFSLKKYHIDMINVCHKIQFTLSDREISVTLSIQSESTMALDNKTQLNAMSKSDKKEWLVEHATKISLPFCH